MAYRIGELSKMAGISGRTLRYYDEIGLLKPMYTDACDQRYYGLKEVKLLQQILFYRKRGLALKEIQKILYQADFDCMAAMNEHLLKLETERARIDGLIENVKKTIQEMKGDYMMSDKERFEAFKAEMVQANEAKYGKEVRKNYGDEAVEASNRKMLNMSPETWEEFTNREAEIKKRLESAVKMGIPSDSETAAEIVRLHKAWLCMTWKNYSLEAHRGLAMMYVTDERFRIYYDSHVEGCAQWLAEAIQSY